ncbi:ABC transporter substrate-binding protein [Rhabdaerophilum sp. SD176]|uniref:ABC transporter substrate-binding protein n=1 Tax=Rhabdaerophilum sp. SD176 TaxID=2983548 RepID=UPI0024DFCD4C|nr:ABC transporter substrate-binding protein [Rhabdaerophilum sp. SD176]
MLHPAAMPWKRVHRQCRLAALSIFLSAAAFAQPAPTRIVSINMCTDQLLLDLARPEQIVGLSPFGADPLRSWAAAKAKPYPRLSGTAEEVLVLAPDLVVGGRFTRRATREFIRQQGFRLEEFDAVRSIAETRAQILRMGALVGNPEGAQRRVEEIDAALARLKSTVSPLRLRVLPVARRGWVSGSQSLVTDLLAQVGLVNVADELGFRQGGFASLESLVLLKPDAILVARDDLAPEDQGTAKLLHPALAGRFTAGRKLTMPEKLTVCGGPMLVEAIDHLTRELARIGRK